MSTNSRIVVTFLDALAADDLATALSLLHPDVEWRNAGLPTLRGDRVVSTLKQMDGPGTEFGVEWNHVAETEAGVVVTDRYDTLGYKRLRTRFWVMGTFHLADGKITVWDDKFSMRNFLGGALRATLRGR